MKALPAKAGNVKERITIIVITTRIILYMFFKNYTVWKENSQDFSRELAYINY
tara:strand:- start:252 stop:410 length:159 start_codon:yes stop_codon:yes gene_type:complete